MSALRDAALGYGQRRRPVFPVNLAKAPLTARGFKDATTDERTIRRWWSDHPDAGIATPTGPNWFVLDDDTNGLAIANLEAEYELLPPTVEVVTPRPGLHRYLRGEATNSSNNLPDGLDVRGRGGYVLLPPSPHRNGVYEWRTAPDEAPIARAPPWLLKLLADPANGTGADLDSPEELLPHGRRHPHLKDCAVRLARGGFDHERITAYLECEFELCCEPDPPPTRGYFSNLAKWAVQSRIAARRRRRTIAGLAEVIRQRRESLP